MEINRPLPKNVWDAASDFTWQDTHKGFKVKNGSAVWESAVAKASGMVEISRIDRKGRRPFLMGLFFKSRIVPAETEISEFIKKTEIKS